MLNSIEINGFLRIPYLQADLRGAPVHVFCGPNEAGKSSLGEAVRFAIRGLSPRVRHKKSYGELITNGKRSGSVEIDLGGFPVRRNVKDGKVATKAALDYPDLLVDIQLGAIEFGLAPTDDARGEKGLRSMLNELFQVGAQDEFLRARLAAKGVTEDMMRRTLPLIRASGFDAASEAAKTEQSRARGEWEGITRETYGSVKAKDWRPELLSRPEPEPVDQLRETLSGHKGARDDLNRRLGAIAEATRLRQSASNNPIEVLEERLAGAQLEHKQNTANLSEQQNQYQEASTEMREQIRKLENDLDRARHAAATLECPCCGAQLHAKTIENTPVLVMAEKGPAAEARGSATAIAKAITDTRAALRTLQESHKQVVDDLHALLSESQRRVAQAESAIEIHNAAASQPEYTAQEQEDIATQIADLDQKIAALEAHIQDADEISAARNRARSDERRAAEVAERVAQWAILAEALGSGPNGIPAELVAATTKPINTALSKLALPWGKTPCVMGADLSLSRADGVPYYLLSGAAQWTANAMMQLALATVSSLKLVVLDGFDIIQPSDRGGFFDMLEDFSQRHPDVSVLVMGTLKGRPMENIDGMQFHWIEGGQLQAA